VDAKVESVISNLLAETLLQSNNTNFTRFAAMVSKSIDIHTAGLAPFEPSTRRLVLELAPTALTVFLWDKNINKPIAVEVFNGDIVKAGDRQVILEQSQLLAFKELETLVISAFPNILPIPSVLYSPTLAQGQLNLLFGQNNTLYTGGDVIADLSMVLSWQMPATIHQFLVNRFKILQVKHLVTNLIEKHNSTINTQGNLVVHGNWVWLVLWQNGKLLITKSIYVEHSDDLSYQLLNICKQFQLDTKQVEWQLSGMVQQESPMWAAVSRFFEQVAEMPAKATVPEDLPGHYFAHLF
jgi:hypothetical protein